MTDAPETETDANGLRVRLVERQREWLWNEATDDALAGYGHHMSQMLYRLPVDGQTRDMQSSIESMLADMSALLADLDAARERVRVVEGERDAAREQGTRLADGLYRWRDDARGNLARAESAEAAHEAEKAAHERLRAGVEALADESGGSLTAGAAQIRRELRVLLGGGEAR